MVSAQSALPGSVRAIVDSSGATFAVMAIDLGGGRTIAWNEREMFHAASTMKTPVMIEVFRQAAFGRFALDDSLVVKNEFKSIVDGSPYAMDLKDDSDDSMYGLLGRKVTVRHLVEQMITVSSNLATNILIDLVGADSTTATMRRLGAPDILVLRGVEDGKAFERRLNNQTTAADLATIFRAVAEEKAVSPGADREMVEVLLRQRFRDKIPALLPTDVRVAHKTGNITGVEHDSGIIYLPDGRAMVMVILSRGWQDQRDARGTIANVARGLFDELSKREP
ncbi:MAG: class A beta-lactamase-related serine hydrolase [Bacteroidetes bacterium]|jgi:beta-lactamase class A|nr:class A beta-lactamase-related serine hydrolase [Bacteroidota bacterium]